MVACQFPTDRESNAPAQGVGVDTLALRGPAPEGAFERLRDLRVSRIRDVRTDEVRHLLNGGFTLVQVEGTEVRVFLDRKAPRLEAKIEFSAPAVLYGHNRNALCLEALDQVAELVHGDVSEQLGGLGSFESFRYTRKDFVRDFVGVEDTGATLDLLSRIRVPRAPRQVSYDNDLRTQTVNRVVKGRWQTRVYDKQREMMSRAATRPRERHLLSAWATVSAGRLRFELQAQARLLKERGLHQMNASQDSQEALVREFFERSGFDRPTTGGRSRTQDALRALAADGRQRDAQLLLVYLGAGHAGVDVLTLMSRKSRDKARALANRLRLSPQDLTDAAIGSRRLDFDGGREVTEEPTGRQETG